MGIQNSIWSNRLKSILLIVSFPIILFVVIRIFFLILMILDRETINYNLFYKTTSTSLSILMLILPIILIAFLISFFLNIKLIFLFSGAKKIERKDNPEIYNIVENLCISRGLPIPNIGILEDNSLNAFATGRGKKSRIVFSRGIINKLEKNEIEAVAGHELTHIINKDTLLMVVIVLFIGIIGTIGETFFKVGVNGIKEKEKERERDKDTTHLLLISLGIILMTVGYLIFPIIRLAISRKREYLADAGSVELTKDKNAMISALKKISQDSVIESIKKQTVAAMCIESPFDVKKKNSRFKNILSTHPSIEDRIKVLEGY